MYCFVLILAVSLYQQKGNKTTTKNLNAMTNLINSIKGIENEVKQFGITEIFVMNGEVYTTSKYDLPYELIEKIESIVLN